MATSARQSVLGKKTHERPSQHCSMTSPHTVTDSWSESPDLEAVSSDVPSCPTPPLTLRCVQLPSELGTSRLEFSSATSCVQNLVYKISKESR